MYLCSQSTSWDRRSVAGRVAWVWIIWALALLPSAPVASAEESAPVRLAMEALGAEARIEVRGMEREAATAAIRLALLEIHEVATLLDPDAAGEGGLGAVQRASGVDSVDLDPRVESFLVRAMQYCLWSSNAFGPVGGEIYRLWQLRDDSGATPQPFDLRQAVASAECAALRVETGGNPRAALAEGSRLSSFGMGRGFAIDQAMEVLQAAGVDNAFVEIGDVVRAIGGGPDGRGWLVAIPGVKGTRDPVDQVWLQNASLALVHYSAEADGRPRATDLRTGVPAQGVVQVAAVSELAIDTQALATTLFVVGMTQGQRLLGALDPRPSVFWLLGSGSGAPLESAYRWSELRRFSRPR